MEIWKAIPGYEGYYEVSDRGQIRSLHKHSTGYILSIYNHNGYPTVILSKRGKWKHQRIQRLMALAFLPNPEKRPQVHVVDGNPNNLTLENLKWVTKKEAHLLKQTYRLWKEVGQTINSKLSNYSLLMLTNNYTLQRNAAVA